MKEVKFQGFQEFLNERLKPVTKRDWEKANGDQRIDWLLQAYDDSDEAEKYEFTDFRDLPDEATASMYLESVINEDDFKVGDKVKMAHGGSGVVKSLDKKSGADDEKYYNVELPSGEVHKHSPNELTKESITESTMSDIDILAQEAKDFKTFVKEFTKEYNDLANAGEPGMFKEWLLTVYNVAKENMDEALMTQTGNDFVAKYSGTKITLKKGYKHHTEDELTDLYNKIGELVKDNLKVKDVTILFESVVTEGVVEPQIKKIAELIGETPKKVEAYVSSRGLNITSVLQHIRDNKEDAPEELRAAINGNKSSDDLFIFLHKA
jgi:hypothetical protein